MVTKGQMIYLLSNSVNQFFKEVTKLKWYTMAYKSNNKTNKNKAFHG